MKRILPIFLLLILLLSLLPGCSGAADPPSSAESGSHAESEPESEPEPLPEIDRRAEHIYASNPQLMPVDYSSPALLPYSEDMGEEYLGKICFICDSPTYWMWPFGLLKDGENTTQIWTGAEGTMTLAYQSTFAILDPFDNTEKPIRQVVEEHKPEYLIIALGINGIMFMDEKYFVDEYTDLVRDIQEISPDTKLMLQSIYPITPAYRYWGGITNAMITEANRWIMKIAEENDCRYLDSISVLLGEDGNAIPELMMNDGLHPNYDGLSLVVEYIRTHAWRPVGETGV